MMYVTFTYTEIYYELMSFQLYMERKTKRQRIYKKLFKEILQTITTMTPVVPIFDINEKIQDDLREIRKTHGTNI